MKLKRPSLLSTRMRGLAKIFPHPSHPDYKEITEAALWRVEADLLKRRKHQERKERFPSFVTTRLEGGSGLCTSETIRHFFREYLGRFAKYGPHEMPLSFSVMESFLPFSHAHVAFDILQEKEHLVHLHDYIDWYTAGKFPDEPGSLMSIMEESCIYSFDILSPLEDYSLTTRESSVRIGGIALVRHQHELSILITAGESPPVPSNADLLEDPLDDYTSVDGREDLRPAPSLSIEDRFLPQIPGHARLILLTQIDLEFSRYNVVYILQDCGSHYSILTDDAEGLEDVTLETKTRALARLERYSDLLSSALCMIYLPAYFIDRVQSVVETKFSTSLGVNRSSRRVRRAIKMLGKDEVPLSRVVRCLGTTVGPQDDKSRLIEPPPLEFRSEGYWRTLDATMVGKDRQGNPVVGKTWVERLDSWSQRNLASLTLTLSANSIDGPDPGVVYIMRSDSHVKNLYKVGLTRRNVFKRAGEISGATGVPTGLSVLAEWYVGDCSTIEKAVHDKLCGHRVNRRREFFQLPLPKIISVINDIIQEHEH